MNGNFEIYGSFDEALNNNGCFVTVLHGVSMYPMVRNGKDPVLMAAAEERLKPYDVAVYAASGKYVVHRVLKVGNDAYIIRGDNCISCETVPFEKVRAKLVGFWRFGKYIPTDNAVYKAYSRIWVFLNPVLKVKRKVDGLLSRCKSHIKRYL